MTIIFLIPAIFVALVYTKSSIMRAWLKNDIPSSSMFIWAAAVTYIIWYFVVRQ